MFSFVNIKKYCKCCCKWCCGICTCTLLAIVAAVFVIPYGYLVFQNYKTRGKVLDLDTSTEVFLQTADSLCFSEDTFSFGETKKNNEEIIKYDGDLEQLKKEEEKILKSSREQASEFQKQAKIQELKKLRIENGYVNFNYYLNDFEEKNLDAVIKKYQERKEKK